MAEQALPDCGEHCGTCARCGIEIRTKPRQRTVKGTTERAERKTVSVRLPEGFNGEEWDELIESVDLALKGLEDSPLDPSREEPVVGMCVVYGLQAFLGLGG